MTLSKETLESWYTPRKLGVTCQCLTEKEEEVAEDICGSCGKVDCTCDADTMDYMERNY